MNGKLQGALALCGLALWIGGCGGGGGQNMVAPPSAQIEGAYEGTTADGQDFRALALADGRVWMAYTSESESGFVSLAGTGYGRLNQDNGFTDFSGSTPATGTLRASPAANRTLQGSVTLAGSGAVAFSGLPMARAKYDYDAPAVLNSIQTGAALMQTPGGTNAVISIDGNLATENLSGFILLPPGDPRAPCTFAGTVTPLTTANVFDLVARFGNEASCAMPGVSISGIVTKGFLDDGTTPLLALFATDGTRTFEFTLFGTR